MLEHCIHTHGESVCRAELVLITVALGVDYALGCVTMTDLLIKLAVYLTMI